MSKKKQIAQLYVELDKIRDRLEELSKELKGDERQDAVASASSSVSDACGALSYVACGKAIEKVRSERRD